MTTNQDYFRRSQNQLQALQEILLDQQESICSEGLKIFTQKSLPKNLNQKILTKNLNQKS